MNRLMTFTRSGRRILAGLVLVAAASVAVGWMAGTAVCEPFEAAANASASDRCLTQTAAGAATTRCVAPDPAYVSGGGTASGSSGGQTTTAAYPIPAYNSQGAAPEGTILATGTGTADMKADGSNKAAALKTATDAALADARAQAQATAASMGVTLKDVYSVSTVSNVGYTYPTTNCLPSPLLPGLDQGGVPVPVPSAVVCPQLKQPTPTSAQLTVTLIVAYKFA